MPFRAMDKHRNDLFQIEAFFLWLGGIVGRNVSEKRNRKTSIVFVFAKSFVICSEKFEIGQGMDATLWRFSTASSGKLSAYSLGAVGLSLSEKEIGCFHVLLEADTLTDVRALLDTRTSSYWENHYLFGRLSSQKEKTMGERSKDLIIINTVVPFLYTYGLHKADERMCERAGRFWKN